LLHGCPFELDDGHKVHLRQRDCVLQNNRAIVGAIRLAGRKAQLAESLAELRQSLAGG
jgi:hypothetical protein